MHVPAVDNDWSCRRWISCRGLGNERETWQRVSWDAMVRPVSVVILINDSLSDTLLATHEAAVPLSTHNRDTRLTYYTRNLVNDRHSRFSDNSSSRSCSFSSYSDSHTESGQCYESRFISSLFEMSTSWGDVWLTLGQAFSRRSLIKRLISGDLC